MHTDWLAHTVAIGDLDAVWRTDRVAEFGPVDDGVDVYEADRVARIDDVSATVADADDVAHPVEVSEPDTLLVSDTVTLVVADRLESPEKVSNDDAETLAVPQGLAVCICETLEDAVTHHETLLESERLGESVDATVSEALRV